MTFLPDYILAWSSIALTLWLSRSIVDQVRGPLVKGDGKQDDAPGINAAISGRRFRSWYGRVERAGDRVWVQGGIHLVRTPISVPPGMRVRMLDSEVLVRGEFGLVVQPGARDLGVHNVRFTVESTGQTYAVLKWESPHG